MSEQLTPPGRTLGIVGGGQLGRMLAEAAAPLGVEVIVLDPTPDCPAAPVARDQIVAAFDDADAIADLAERSDALTFEIELADSEGLERAASTAAVPVHPRPDTLRTIEDKLVQKRTLREADVPVPAFRQVDDADDLRDAIADLGEPVMLKARTGGYDGRGNLPVESAAEADTAMAEIAGPAMAERFVDFERELSVIGVVGDGEVRTFPVGENVHREEILRETIAPARADEDVLEEAQSVARDVLEVLEGRGVYGIELFEHAEPRADGSRISVNEIAPRPHNSGHWTIEGAVTSQFENHVRGVLGLPLGSTELRAETAMANLLGNTDEPRPIAQEVEALETREATRDADRVRDGGPALGDPSTDPALGASAADAEPATMRGVDDLLAAEGAHLHWYGKREVRPLRKLGHVTVTADGTGIEDRSELVERARTLRDRVTFE